MHFIEPKISQSNENDELKKFSHSQKKNISTTIIIKRVEYSLK